jgi:hypothetical protein
VEIETALVTLCHRKAVLVSRHQNVPSKHFVSETAALSYSFGEKCGLSVIMLAVLAVAAYAMGNAVFTPLTQSTRDAEDKWQCYTADILILVFQLGLAGLFTTDPGFELAIASEVAGLFLLWSLFYGGWWVGVRALSFARIREPFRRAVILGIVCPLTFCWPLGSLVCNPLFLAITIIGLPLAVLIIALLLKVCHTLTLWISRPAHEDAYWQCMQRRWPWLAAPKWILLLCLVSGSMYIATWPVWSGLTIGPMFYKTHLVRFRGEMRRTADIPAIQKWMQETDFAKVPQETWGVKTEALPACVRSLSTHFRYTQRKTLSFVWGGGFGHWGLEVAAPGTPMPPSHSRAYYLPLRDGAWVWAEIQ